jgi:hypothetical protein
MVAGELAALAISRGGAECWTAIITRIDSSQNADQT